MKCAKVPIQEIQKARSVLSVSTEYPIQKDKTHAYIPITKKTTKYPVVTKSIQKKERKNFKEEVTAILTKKEKEAFVGAYDVVGTIAIMEIPEMLVKKEKKIAKTLLECVSSVKTVVKKASIHEGELRLQKYTYLAGEKTFVTTHKENGCRLTLDINKVYYSSRSAVERKRIAEQTKPNESVLILFSGCGPFTCVVGKKAKQIVGVELNQDGHAFEVHNIQQNKLKNAETIQGDAREVCKRFKKENRTFDRILMPLPKTAEAFLDAALDVSRKGTIIHFYDFSKEAEFPDTSIAKIAAVCKKAKKKYAVLDSVLCGNYSPRVYRVCIDFSVDSL